MEERGVEGGGKWSRGRRRKGEREEEIGVVGRMRKGEREPESGVEVEGERGIVMRRVE